MATTDKTQTTVSVTPASRPSNTDYDQVTTLNRKVEQHHTGHNVDFTVDTKIDDVLSGTFDDRVREIVNGVVKEREARENERANHRNLNRMLTLFGALLIGLVVTFILTHNGIPGVVKLPKWSMVLAPYTFVITILLDSGLALYGYIRHY